MTAWVARRAGGLPAAAARRLQCAPKLAVVTE